MTLLKSVIRENLFLIALVGLIVLVYPFNAVRADSTVNASADNGSSINPSGTVVVPTGTVQTFDISANRNYKITNVTLDGSSQGAVNSINFTGVAADPITHTITVTSVGTGGIDPMTVVDAWGLDGYHTPMVKGGSTVTDQGNVQSKCYSGYPAGSYNDRCFDITSTTYYKQHMLAVGSDLIKLYGSKQSAIKNAPEFAYWIGQAQ